MRSDVALPTARAELIAQWLDRFAPKARFRAVTVEDQGQLVAAIPLVGRRIHRLLNVGSMPCNDWSPGGELLIDSSADVVTATDVLVRGITAQHWPLLWWECVNPELRAWQWLLHAFERVGLRCHWGERYRVGRINSTDSWEEHQQRWSKNHRRNMRRTLSELEALGLRCRSYTELRADQVDEVLHQGFAVEDRSWKGRAGSSTLQTDGMYQFYLGQARQAADWGQLCLSFLECAGTTIAFEYGWLAKGTYFSFKVGCDPELARHSPGQVLMHELLKWMHHDPAVQATDCLGPMFDAVSRRVPDTYPIGRLVVANRGITGSLLMNGCRQWSTPCSSFLVPLPTSRRSWFSPVDCQHERLRTAAGRGF